MNATYAQEAAAQLAKRLHSCGALWVLGGSTGLAMRGAELARAPRDIDLYADDADARLIHAHLQKWATDTPQLSVTARYRSVLSHYELKGSTVELVGDFRIETDGCRYRTEVADMLHPNGDSLFVQGAEIRLVPLGHELIFNVLRNRPDRCALIGRMIRQQPERHLPTLHALLQRNELTAQALRQIALYTEPSGAHPR